MGGLKGFQPAVGIGDSGKGWRRWQRRFRRCWGNGRPNGGVVDVDRLLLRVKLTTSYIITVVTLVAPDEIAANLGIATDSRTAVSVNMG